MSIRNDTATTTPPITHGTIIDHDGTMLRRLQHPMMISTEVRNIHSNDSMISFQQQHQKPSNHYYFARYPNIHNCNVQFSCLRLYSNKSLFLKRQWNLFHHDCFKTSSSSKMNTNGYNNNRDSSVHDGWTSIRYIQTSSTKPTNRSTGSSTKQHDDIVDAQQGLNTTTTTTTNINTTTSNNSENTNMNSKVQSPMHDEPNDQPIRHQPPQPLVVVQHWLQQLRAIPNIITVSRIILIPFISYWIIQHQTMLAFIGCVYAAISDVLDGYIARKYPSMQTPLGTYLDPLADKLFINALSISLWVNGTLPTTLVGLWLIRDVILMIATHQYVAQNTTPGMAVMDPVTVPIQVIPTTLSKINTAFQFITLVVGIVAIPPPIMAVAVSTATDSSDLTTIVTSTMDTLRETYSTNLDEDCHTNTNPTHYWHDFDNMFLVQRMYITENILPSLCWITGTTTIGSSLSYYGHSAFISTAKDDSEYQLKGKMNPKNHQP